MSRLRLLASQQRSTAHRGNGSTRAWHGFAKPFPVLECSRRGDKGGIKETHHGTRADFVAAWNSDPDHHPLVAVRIFPLARNEKLTRNRRNAMARRYSRAASKDVEREMRKFKRGTLRSGKGGKGGKGGRVKSRKQAIAIGLSEARREGKKVPKRRRR
jgi:Family of unknown function (DUF6496)